MTTAAVVGRLPAYELGAAARNFDRARRCSGVVRRAGNQVLAMSARHRPVIVAVEQEGRSAR
jgi:hypothetical protein